MHQKCLSILGIRGLPAAHGGFETFAEYLSKHLVAKGWNVTVFCQEFGSLRIRKDVWEGIRRIRIQVPIRGSLGSVLFDLISTVIAARMGNQALVLGYNTALFGGILRLTGVRQVINMDGIEWKRDKWGALAKAWFYMNEIIAARLGNHLVADHPEIARHLSRHTPASKITVIAYGAERVCNADVALLKSYCLEPGGYSIVIARPEPENSVLEIVRAFSRVRREHKLVVLGNFDADNPYHARVKSAASAEVMFLGAIYDSSKVACLRMYSRFYFHGHRVGGTNPSLVEALGAGCAVVAHDNAFNHWVAKEAAVYFRDQEHLEQVLEEVLKDAERIRGMKTVSREVHEKDFTWGAILQRYEALLSVFK